MSVSYRAGDKIGDKLGPKLIPLIAQTVASVKLKTLDTEHRARVHSIQTVIDRAGREVADLYRPLLREMMADDKTPDHVKQFIGKITSGTHQWQAIFGLAMTVGNVAGLTGGLFSGTTRAIAYAANRDDPNVLPDLGTISSLVTRGWLDRATATMWALDLGISPDTFGKVAELTYQWGDPVLAQQLENRGLLTGSEVDNLLEVQGIPPSMRDNVRALRRQVLSPADLADMVVRGIMTEQEGAQDAGKSGVSSGDFAKLVLDTGEPPSLTDLLMAHRRGFIDTARLVHGIRQSRVRDEWIDVIEALSQSPMSTADAVQAFIQGHIDSGRAAQIAAQNGLIPDQLPILEETAGEPLSKTEAIQLLRRKVITVDIAKQALRESRLKNKYIDQVLAEVRAIPPAREIATLYSHGALTEQQAAQLMSEDGYDAEVITAMLHSAVSQKIVHVKQLTEAQWRDLYRARAITRTQLIESLKPIGYSQHYAELIAELEDLRIEIAARTSAINHIRSLYIAGKVDEKTAEARLDGEAIPSAQRDILLHDWNLEKATNIRTLTPAQILDAWEINQISGTDAVARLQHEGYDRADSILLLKIKGKVVGKADGKIP